MKVGFVGLGIMGKPMALHLLEAGFPLTVYNRTASKCRPLAEAGAVVANSPAEVARRSEATIIIVNDTPDVESVLFGPDGAAEGLGAGKVVIDMSTVSPDATQRWAEQLRQMGVEMLDAPVSGGERGAQQGTLTIMVGGNRQTFERCLPLLEAMGKNIVWVGPNGSGQRVKLVNQLLCGIHVVAMDEALTFAREAGLDLSRTLQVVSSGAAGSWILSNLGPKVVAGEYHPGFKIKLQQKDLRLARESVEKLGLELPGLEHAYQQLTKAVKQGLGELGTEGLIKLYA